MGPLVAVGGLLVSDEALGQLESGLGAICADFGFPANDEFKWSPGRRLWMRSNLVGQDREGFFRSILGLASRHDAIAIVIAEDLNRSPATAPGRDHELDATVMLLERVNNLLGQLGNRGVVIADRQGGGRPRDDAFLLSCLETLREGTDYTSLERIPVNVFSAASKFVRCLQLADVITGCCLSLIAGESQYSPPLFRDTVRPLLYRSGARIAGYGFKLHPDGRYGNLYHWLLGETNIWKRGVGHPLPIDRLPYATDEMTP